MLAIVWMPLIYQVFLLPSVQGNAVREALPGVPRGRPTRLPSAAKRAQPRGYHYPRAALHNRHPPWCAQVEDEDEDADKDEPELWGMGQKEEGGGEEGGGGGEGGDDGGKVRVRDESMHFALSPSSHAHQR